MLKGQNALPYLVDRYGYPCFKETLEIVEIQYNEMPDAFKGHFTVDLDGEIIQLRSSEKSRKMMDEFFKKLGMRKIIKAPNTVYSKEGVQWFKRVRCYLPTPPIVLG